MIDLLASVPRVGILPSGSRNLITDIDGVRVGHVSLVQDNIQTGVTVIMPHTGDTFLEKTPAAACVINGFGKSIGLVQVSELGVLETPIALTNTFSVGQVAQAQMRQACTRLPKIGREWPTVNPLVFECNDGYLNDIQAFAITEEHYLQAYQSANVDFQQGSVGAGRGMSAFQLKGGIGSASRRIDLPSGQSYQVGALVLANFGQLPRLQVGGVPLGRLGQQYLDQSSQPEVDKGSIIMILATDAPLDSRQLARMAKRAGAGLARTGSVYGHGSGDIALAFSTAWRIPFDSKQPMPAQAMLHESHMDSMFTAAAEAIEQSIINALWSAETVVGRSGHIRQSLRDWLPQWQDILESHKGIA